VRLYTDIDPDKERVVVTFAGSVDLHDVTEMMFFSAKAGALSFPTLIDAGDGSVNLSPEDMGQILANIRELASRSKIAKCAVLVSNPASLATVTTISQLLAGVSPIEGFLDRNDAERWLGWKT
jgi:hypothetical protein